MGIEIRLLKADPDAATPARIEAAYEIAQDPDAPRRALANGPSDRAVAPMEFAGQMANQPPRSMPPDAADAWRTNWIQRLESVDHRYWERLLGSLAGGAGSLEDLTPAQRREAYDGLSVKQRYSWDAAFLDSAIEWVGVAAAQFGGKGDVPWASGWNQNVRAIETQEGGQLLICAATDPVFDGVPMWFEAVEFALAEVADAAGFREPSRFHVE